MKIIIKSEDFLIQKTTHQQIVKTVSLNKYQGMLSGIYIQTISKYLDKIIITAGPLRIFMWNKNEIEDYAQNNKNIFKKYKLNQAIPLIYNSYHKFEINFIFNNEKVYNDSEIKKVEYIEKIASEDNDKIVEYWDINNGCVCEGYGVKYEEVKKVKDLIISAPKINTPEVKLIYNNDIVNIKTNYAIEFYDDKLAQKNYLRYSDSMYGLVYSD